MGKVNLLVKYCLINEEISYNIKGILINDQIKFLDSNNKMILNKSNITLQRITETLEINLDFKKKKCFVYDKSSKNYFNFKIRVLKLLNNTKDFYVKYQIEKDNFEVMIKII